MTAPHQSDTIFALSSGQGRAGIAIIRISGPRAGATLLALAGAVPQPRLASLRRLKAADSEILDEAMVLWFPAPHSATGEDVAELHVHGASVVVAGVFRELSALGLRLAEAGEFTRRAYDSGKLDLVEAEGLADLLSASGEAQRRLAMRQFLGEASAAYGRWRDDVIMALGLHEAAIDFSDEDDVAGRAIEAARPILIRLRNELMSALAKAAQAGAVRSGLKVVIAGAPNVGKSSLLNALVGREAAIVSAQAGTTRDVVDVPLMLDGLPLVLSDTAGLRASTEDAIERIGMARAGQAVADADILIWVRAPDVAEQVGPPRKPDLVVRNKCDLDLIHNRNESDLPVSAKSASGMNHLRAALQKMIHGKLFGLEDAVVVRERHRLAVQESIRLLDQCLDGPDRAAELVAEDLRKVARALSSVTGHVDVEDLLGKIFGEFCIGK